MDQQLYNSISCIDTQHHLFGWEVYMDLYETYHNPEPFSFYDWSEINDEPRFNEIFTLKNDFQQNIDNAINIVKEIIIENINFTNGYNYKDNKITLEWWVIEGLYKCSHCGNIWDGCAQCICYYDDDAAVIF